MKQSELTIRRLQKVLLSDKITNPAKMTAVIKSDIFWLLNDYMVLSKDELSVALELCDDGRYRLKIEAVTDRLKDIGL